MKKKLLSLTIILSLAVSSLITGCDSDSKDENSTAKVKEDSVKSYQNKKNTQFIEDESTESSEEESSEEESETTNEQEESTEESSESSESSSTEENNKLAILGLQDTAYNSNITVKKDSEITIPFSQIASDNASSVRLDGYSVKTYNYENLCQTYFENKENNSKLSVFYQLTADNSYNYTVYFDNISTSGLVVTWLNVSSEDTESNLINMLDKPDEIQDDGKDRTLYWQFYNPNGDRVARLAVVFEQNKIYNIDYTEFNK